MIPARLALMALTLALSLASPRAVAVQAAPEAPREADRIIQSLEERYARGGSLTASFTQTFRSAATSQQVVERGRLFVKRPGRMRWDTKQPEKKVFLVRADGTTLSYVPSDYTAITSRLPVDAPHLRLLIGDSRLLDSFAASEVKLKAPVFPGSKQIKLTPRKPTEGVEVVYLELDPRTLGVERVLLVDPLGNESDLVLEKLSEESRLEDDVFDIQLPPGVAVREAGEPVAGSARDAVPRADRTP